jgi:hypothetical protein
MMKKIKRRWLWLLAGLAVAMSLFVGSVFFSGSADCPISRTVFQQLRLGMTEVEVNDLLGIPPGDYTSGPAWSVLDPQPSILVGKVPFIVAKTEFWSDDQTGISVSYDNSGKLVGAATWPISRRPIRHAMHRYVLRAFGGD